MPVRTQKIGLIGATSYVINSIVGCGIFQLHLQPVLPTTDTIYLELEDGYMVAISVFSQESNPLTINPMDMEIQYVPMKRA